MEINKRLHTYRSADSFTQHYTSEKMNDQTAIPVAQERSRYSLTSTLISKIQHMIVTTKLSGVFFLILFANVGYSQERPTNFDFGHVEDNKYVNSYFGFEMSLHPDWIVQTKEQMESMAKTGKALVAGNDSQMKAVIEASEINIANLLAVSQFERGSAVEYNPSMTLVAENIKQFPGIKSGNDYLFQARKILEQSQLKYDSIDRVFIKEVINGTDFYKMNAEIKYMGLSIKQVYYSTVASGFSFNAIISYVSDQQKKDLLELIHSMKFRN